MSAYDNDPRVQFGVYEALVVAPDGPMYLFTADSAEDWVAAPEDAHEAMRSRNHEALAGFADRYPHFGSIDEAIHSLIGDPQ